MEPQHTGLIAEDVFCCVTEVIDLVSIQEEFPVICRLPLPRVEELTQHDLQSHNAPLSAKQAVPSSICSMQQLACQAEQQSVSAYRKTSGSTAQLHCHAPTLQTMGTCCCKRQQAHTPLALPAH